MKNKFNAGFHYLWLIPAFSLLFSCKKFLEIQPKEYTSDDLTITDKNSAETALRGAYNALSNGNYYGSGFQSIGYLSGGDLRYVGSVVSYRQFIQHNVRPDNTTLSSVWGAIYKTINFTNHLISKIPEVEDVKFTQEQKNQYIGEAHFIRALAYFDLARTWGGVQLVTTPTTSLKDREGIKRSTLAQTYELVLSDLNKAEALFPVSTLNRVRVTQKAVYALRARYSLYQKDWAQAENYSTRVINDNNYTLIAPYSSWFANNVVATKESILELSYNQSSNPNGHRNSWQPASNKGTMSWGPTDEWVALVRDPAIAGNRGVLVARDPNGVWYGNLYYRTTLTDPSYILRIAEQFLIRAEARAEQNKLPDALGDLNAVRIRAGLPGILYNSATTTRESVLLAIENERRFEFAFEPQRWYDLVRTGRAATELGVTDRNKYVLPVPISEIQTDKSVEQNEGYN